jgi:hypothetical protein
MPVPGEQDKPPEQRGSDAAQPIGRLDAEGCLAFVAIGVGEGTEFGYPAHLPTDHIGQRDTVFAEGLLGVALEKGVRDRAGEAVAPRLRIEPKEMLAIIIEIGAPQETDRSAPRILVHVVPASSLIEASGASPPRRHGTVRRSIY